MTVPTSLLISCLLDPSIIRDFSVQDWELCIRQARSSQLLARLAISIRERGLDGLVPAAPNRHLVSAVESHLHLCQATRNEVEHLLDAFEESGIRLVLLKGAAYVMADLPPGRCRTFNDIDLLVPKNRLSDAEMALLLNGWVSEPHSVYDDYYYRTWMHEIPPLHHLKRESVIDIHHNLVPETAPVHPNPEQLLLDAVACPGRDDVLVLSAYDMILHSAVHLFNDGEFDHGLRDLFDIRDLVLCFLKTDRHWQNLVDRSKEMDLCLPMYYALRYLNVVLQVEVSDETLVALCGGRFSKYRQQALDAIFLRALQPDHPSCGDSLTSLARFVLYVRGHALRMPMHLLLPHLVRKGWRRFRDAYFSRSENVLR